MKILESLEVIKMSRKNFQIKITDLEFNRKIKKIGRFEKILCPLQCVLIKNDS